VTSSAAAVALLGVAGVGTAVVVDPAVPAPQKAFHRQQALAHDTIHRAAVHRATVQRAARTRAVQKASRLRREHLPWTLPVESYHLTGRFGQNGDRWSSFHHGLDFAAPEGSPVYAVAAGTIISAGWDDAAYGRRIKVLHDDGTVTLYAHLSGFARRSGEVGVGTVIGYVGSTGNATGPHLHLEIRPDGGSLDSSIDPDEWLRDKGLDP